MTLFQQDQTGTQTNCPKPLSRKKLRQLRWHHPVSTSGGWLEGLLNRRRGKAHRSGARVVYHDRVLKTGQLQDGTKYELHAKTPLTFMERMADRFKVVLGKFQRAQKRGGQA